MDKREAFVTIIFVTSLVFLVFDIYYFNYDLFYRNGFGSSWFEERVSKMELHNSILYFSPIISRIFVLATLTISIVMAKVKMKLTEKEERKSYLIPSTVGIGFSFIFLYQLYNILGNSNLVFVGYLIFTILLFFLYINFLSTLHRMYFSNLLGDRFQKKSRNFEQFNKLLENEYSVNLKTEDGVINVVNPFRASQVLGTPGSGKSYSFLIEALIQHIKKGFAIMVYDYKFPDLSLIAYNALKRYYKNYDVQPQFAIINFDDLTRSNRCNPFQPELMHDPTDATKIAQALMFGLYPKWAQKSGEFFTESSINFVAACIWGLKQVADGKYCSLPHLIQFIALDYNSLFKVLKELDDHYINNVIAPFLSAYENEATDQLEGQIGTTRIALSRLTSPNVYWVMTPEENDKNGISLHINDPKNPLILCIANNPDKQSVYAPILSVYNTRIMSLINKKHQQKTAFIIDELPTLSFPPGTLDNLIATARSNKIAVWLGFQDFAQLTRDLGKEIAEAIINTVGNTFAGMVNFDTAKKLSEKFGKLKVKKESVTVSKESTSVSHSTQMEELIPPSEISSLEQGVFVGQVADDRGYEIDQKIFYSKVLIDHEERKQFEKGEIPAFVEFEKPIKEAVEENFKRVINDINEMASEFNQILD